MMEIQFLVISNTPLLSPRDSRIEQDSSQHCDPVLLTFLPSFVQLSAIQYELRMDIAMEWKTVFLCPGILLRSLTLSVDIQQENSALFAYHKTMAFFYCPLTSSPRINFVLLLHTTGQANVCPSYLCSGTASGSYPAD